MNVGNGRLKNDDGNGELGLMTKATMPIESFIQMLSNSINLNAASSTDEKVFYFILATNILAESKA